MNDLIMKMALPIIMGVVEELLNKENIQKYGDALFDFIEEAVKNSKTTIDDITVLPLVNALRSSLDIPDND
jgi:hypothetical protein